MIIADQHRAAQASVLRAAWPFTDLAKPFVTFGQTAEVLELIARPERKPGQGRKPGKSSIPKRVRTPGGPRPAEQVHLVKPGQVVRRMPDQSYVINRTPPKGARK